MLPPALHILLLVLLTAFIFASWRPACKKFRNGSFGHSMCHMSFGLGIGAAALATVVSAGRFAFRK